MTDTRELVERYVMEVDSDFGDDAKAIPVADPWGQWVLASDYDAISERCRALEEALQFYADTGKYPAPLTGGCGDLYFDCGRVARAALTSGGRV